MGRVQLKTNLKVALFLNLSEGGVERKTNLKVALFLHLSEGGFELKTNLKVALFLHLSEGRVESGLDEDLGVGFTQNRLADQLLQEELVTY